jgi:CBS domain-containing protein
MKVKELMKNAVAVSVETTLKEAAKIMASKRIGSLLITEKNKLAGIVTERDILKAVADDINTLNCKVSKIMSTKIISVEANDNIDDAANLMQENKIKRLPVLRNGKLVGIITITDIIANYDSLGEISLF